MKKKYLITGAAGFVGSALAKRMIENGDEVVTIDNLSTGEEKNIPEGVVFIKGDCQDESIIETLENHKFDAIFHIAGQSSGEVSFENPVYDLQTNTQSTLLLLNLAKKINCAKFIYASTMSVYGDNENEYVDENSPTNPKSFYAVGKLSSEKYLKIYSNLGINTVALRLFNVYGPGQNLKNLKQGMVSIFLAQAITDEAVLVKGSKDRFRDFIFIDDVVDAFLAVLEKDKKGFSLYNVSTGVKTRIGDLVEEILKNIKKNIPVTYKGSTPGDQFGIYGDSESLSKETNWRPKVQFSKGMKKMIDWAISSNF